MIKLEDLNEFILGTDSGFVRHSERNWVREVRSPFGNLKHFITCGLDDVIRCWSPQAAKSIEYKTIEDLKDDTNT